MPDETVTVRVLAMADGIMREVYEPIEWLSPPVEGLENRIAFNGVVAADGDTYVGRDVAHLFRPGSANPVRYLGSTCCSPTRRFHGFRRADCRDADRDICRRNCRARPPRTRPTLLLNLLAIRTPRTSWPNPGMVTALP
jgi:hypothetical protein